MGIMSVRTEMGIFEKKPLELGGKMPRTSEIWTAEYARRRALKMLQVVRWDQDDYERHIHKKEELKGIAEYDSIYSKDKLEYTEKKYIRDDQQVDN
jgi:hypothetical protein